MRNKKKVTINLTRSNAAMAEAVCRILKKPMEEVISSCLKGSTNPARAA